MRERIILVIGGALLLLLVAACSPEAERVRGGGPGADIGNRIPPAQTHGDRTRNNPDFGVPGLVNAPRDTWGAPGWWTTSRAQ